MSIYTKVLAALLATALIPLMAVAIFAYVSVERTVVRAAEQNLRLDALALARSSIAMVEQAFEEVQSWSRIETLQGVFTGEDVDLRIGLLLKDLADTNDFLEVWCLDTTGQIIAASDFSAVGTSHAGVDVVEKPLAGESYVSDVRRRPDGSYAIAIAHPIFGAFDDSTIIGAVVAFYDWGTVVTSVRSMGLAYHSADESLMLLNDQFQVIAARSDIELLGQPIADARASHPIAHMLTEGPVEEVRGAAAAPSEHLGITFYGLASAHRDVVLVGVRRVELIAIMVSLAAVVAIVVASMFLARQLSVPIVALSQAANRIASGDLEVEPPRLGRDEIGQLAGNLDIMRRALKDRIDTLDKTISDRTRALEETVARLRNEIGERREAEKIAGIRQEQLVQADKMVSLGILVSGVAHEINNPNGLISLNLPIVQEAWNKAGPVLEAYYRENGDFSLGALNYSEMRAHLPRLISEMERSSRRISGIVEDLKDFSRPRADEPYSSVNLVEVVESAYGLVKRHIQRYTNKVSVTTGDTPVIVNGSFQRLEQVVVNLLLNAAESLPDSTRGIRVDVESDPAAREGKVIVVDEGCGISNEDLNHVRDPFFTTKRASGGTGLGLSVSSTIVSEHGGDLRFESIVGRGTTVTMGLPLASAGESP